MKERLPVNIENLELPLDKFKHIGVDKKKENYSYGFVSLLQLLSLLITMGSFWVVLFLGGR